jgi:hypothetical protein
MASISWSMIMPIACKSVTIGHLSKIGQEPPLDDVCPADLTMMYRYRPNSRRGLTITLTYTLLLASTETTVTCQNLR